MLTLDPKVPAGPLDQTWTRFQFEARLVSPNPRGAVGERSTWGFAPLLVAVMMSAPRVQ